MGACIFLTLQPYRSGNITTKLQIEHDYTMEAFIRATLPTRCATQYLDISGVELVAAAGGAPLLTGRSARAEPGVPSSGRASPSILSFKNCFRWEPGAGLESRSPVSCGRQVRQ